MVNTVVEAGPIDSLTTGFEADTLVVAITGIWTDTSFVTALLAIHAYMVENVMQNFTTTLFWAQSHRLNKLKKLAFL